MFWEKGVSRMGGGLNRGEKTVSSGKVGTGMVSIADSSVNLDCQTDTHCNIMREIMKFISYIPGTLNNEPAGEALPTKDKIRINIAQGC